MQNGAVDAGGICKVHRAELYASENRLWQRFGVLRFGNPRLDFKNIGEAAGCPRSLADLAPDLTELA